uniref:Myosin_tail_1 domain-containing protein n=1 Tax=Gongylonema pulchrum TaxID=637853 RepID=A0A183DFY5_9BILA
LFDENENLKKDLDKLRSEMNELQKTANEEKAKALAKAESERQRLLRDLQKEIKQLYHDLNERTQQLDEAHVKLQVILICFSWCLMNVCRMRTGIRC